jgi:hypothetical protein
MNYISIKLFLPLSLSLSLTVDPPYLWALYPWVLHPQIQSTLDQKYFFKK